MRSSAPDFKLRGITWECWIVDDGQAYEWRSSCGRYAVIRDGEHWRAKRGERLGQIEYPTIKAAMLGASTDVRNAA